MQTSLTEVLNFCGDLFGYVFWLGGTLWLWKRSIEMNRDVDPESADALRVPRQIGWLLAFNDTDVVSIMGIGGLALALTWFMLSAMMGKYILSIWIYYAFWFGNIVMGVCVTVYFVRHLLWWFRQR